jgi:hypothetical protein
MFYQSSIDCLIIEIQNLLLRLSDKNTQGYGSR